MARLASALTTPRARYEARLHAQLLRCAMISSTAPADERMQAARRSGPGNCLALRGTRQITKPVDVTRLFNMTEKRRVRQKKVKMMRYQPKESDRGWHPELCNYETTFEKDHALYFYNLFLMPEEQGAWERFLDKMERKYFPDDLIDFELDHKDRGKAAKNTAKEQADDSRKQVGNRQEQAENRQEQAENKQRSAEIYQKQVAGQKLQAPIARKNAEGILKTTITSVHEEEVDDWLPITCSTEETSVQISLEEETKPPVSAETKPLVIKRDMELPQTWDDPLGRVLLVDKPSGWTSFDVCAKLRRLFKVKKVGHAGTLDPMATGLLVICLGNATKLADSYQAMTKLYSGTFRLGEATPSYDRETPVSETLPWEHITDADVQKAMQAFLGDIMQVPPLYSALKVEGERLYRKAHRGDSFSVPPRMVSVYEFQIERSSTNRQEFNFTVSCSKGTYIRSLCYDLGRALSTCAHLTSLRREKIGHMSVEDAWRVAELMQSMQE